MKHLHAKFWWILALRGALGIALGVLSLIWLVQIYQPTVDPFGMAAFMKQVAIIQMVVILLGCYAFMDGVFALLLGFQNFGERRHWWSLITEGFLSLGLGVWIFLSPATAIWKLYGWVAIWAVFTGMLEVTQSFKLGEYNDRRFSYFLAGMTSMFFGFALAYSATHPGVLLVWLMGGYALVFGTLLLRLGLRFRHFSVEWEKIKHRPLWAAKGT